MVVTVDTTLPSEADLTVQEVNISISGLRAGSFQLGKHCEYQNDEFMLCRAELKDPRKCLDEGKDVTKCALDFFRKVKKSCAQEFQQFAQCLNQSSQYMEFSYCRKTQAAFDKCVLDNLHIEKPDYGYFSRVKVHDSKRPKPEPVQPTVYPDTPTPLPPKQDYPPSKHQGRHLI